MHAEDGLQPPEASRGRGKNLLASGGSAALPIPQSWTSCLQNLREDILGSPVARYGSRRKLVQQTGQPYNKDFLWTLVGSEAANLCHNSEEGKVTLCGQDARTHRFS